jgi:AraC-like DNA-binding protein
LSCRRYPAAGVAGCESSERTQRYVIQRRLEWAKRLLRQTHQPLALIAQAAGFADQSHLTFVFRREIGVTPGHFRACAST